MKGFVPVTKTALLAMVDNCREEIVNQTASEKAETLDRFVSQEKKRMATRNWYRLWQLPAARFNFDEASVMAYADTIDYPMFDGNPFDHIESDAKNSHSWLNRIERLAESEYAGEPIQLDMKTFLRLSEPHRYYWVRAEGICYTVH